MYSTTLPAMPSSEASLSERIENHLKSMRTSRRLSQAELAARAGITRQAVYSIETGQYLPTTGVALRLATALSCRVEDLFVLSATGEEVEGDLIGSLPSRHTKPVRVTVARVGERLVVRPVADLGGILNFTVAADGLVGPGPRDGRGRQVRVRLLRDRRDLERMIMVAGCDPSIFLAGDHLRRRLEKANVVGWTMGSQAALEGLKRCEVHMAGLHVVDARSGESNLPYLRDHLRGRDLGEVTVVTFASWQQGLMVQPGNPKSVRGIEDLARKDISLVNREKGSPVAGSPAGHPRPETPSDPGL
jgi:DNA-binding XRE family transcriptional regulator